MRHAAHSTLCYVDTINRQTFASTVNKHIVARFSANIADFLSVLADLYLCIVSDWDQDEPSALFVMGAITSNAGHECFPTAQAWSRGMSQVLHMPYIMQASYCTPHQSTWTAVSCSIDILGAATLPPLVGYIYEYIKRRWQKNSCLTRRYGHSTCVTAYMHVPALLCDLRFRFTLF